MKKIGILLLIALIGNGCLDEHPAIATFTGDMIYSYLKKDTTYSEFVKIVDKAGLSGMLNAYGDYTCLAPTNSAFREYYRKLGNNFSINNLTQGQIDTIAKTHIVPNKYRTFDLSDGVLPNTNMNKRYIEINFKRDSVKNKIVITLNDSSRIVLKDIEVYNGVVDGIDRILKPSVTQLPELMGNNPDISIFTEALVLTRLSDSLRLITDKNYKPKKVFLDEYNTFEIVNPSERRFGYTAFVEDNEVLKANGINNLNDLIQKAKELYPGDSKYDNDFTNSNNSLNKYIAYHLINKFVFLNKFFYTRNTVKNIIPEEFFETKLLYRIIRANKINDKITLNTNTGHTVHIKETGSKTTINGIYHLLDNMLVYTPDVEHTLQNIRIRYDFSSIFPELTNNNIRGSEGFMKINNSSGDRFGFEMGYLTGISFSDHTRLLYLAGKDGQWASCQSDEVMALGAYDVTIRLLPVPPGTYEIRFGYSAWDGRSVTQMYIDGKPQGIPLDLKITADNPQIGFILDKNTDDNGYENDKVMRNRGYMKSLASMWITNNHNGRDESSALRRIVGTFTFSDYSSHTLRFRSVMTDVTKQCMMDYIEIVPKSVFNDPSGEPESRL